jgi:hypothetical protein
MTRRTKFWGIMTPPERATIIKEHGRECTLRNNEESLRQVRTILETLKRKEVTK